MRASGCPSTLHLAVLGLLQERPMHPYEIQHLMRRRRLDRSFKLNFGALYHAIESLQKQGHIETLETAREGRRPERTVYSVTPAGRDAFQAHLANLVAEPAAEFSRFEAGLSFISYLEQDHALRLLRERIHLLDARIEEGAAVQATLIAMGLARLSLIEEEHSQALRAAEKAWIARLVAEIESGHLEWRCGMSPPSNFEESQVRAAGLPVPAAVLKEA